MKNKKGALELSVSTIIVIVIGVTLLTLGLVYVKNMFTNIGLITDEAFRVADKEVQQMMSGDEKFYVSGIEFPVKAGESITINTGIQNLEGYDDKFMIKVSSADDESDTKWVTTPKYQNIPAGEKKGIPIVIKAPKNVIPKSIFMYSLNVINGKGLEYDSSVITVKII